jgi:predicted nucleic acid-binding protein
MRGRSIATHSMSDASPRFTLDTNILIYTMDRSAGHRHRLAEEIVERSIQGDCWLTLQAISEFYSAITRKRVMSPATAAALAGDWLTAFPTAAASASAIRVALTHAVSGRASYWDALLVATAAEAGCTVILTEDMADGSALGGIRIHNPFASTGGLTEEAQRLLAR